MSTTSKQDKDFLNDVIGDHLLETSIEWIKSNFSAEELYGEKELMAWARNYDPEGIFNDKELQSWAEANGYIKE